MSEQPCVVLCDLDGVVWLAHQAIAGAADGVAHLRAHGHRVLFVTNNSAATLGSQEASLAAIGVPAVGDVVTSAQAAAQLVVPGERVLVCGDEGLVEAMLNRGAVLCDDDHPDVVVVGFHRSFGYEGLRRASAAVRRGARLIGSNDDATYPTPDGPIPGGGAILAAVEKASGVHPVVAGKPYAPMADLVRSVIGDGAVASAIMVGDRPETDGLFAQRLGCRYAQVWSGVTATGATVTPPPDFIADDLGTFARAFVTDRYAPR